MKDLMKELKSKGYRLLGLSNWSTKVFDVIYHPHYRIISKEIFDRELKENFLNCFRKHTNN